MEKKPGDPEGLAETPAKVLPTELASAIKSEVKDTPVIKSEEKDPTQSTTDATSQPDPPEFFPDPDEDDLDDLDDMLDEFTPAVPEAPLKAPSTEKPPVPTTNPLSADVEGVTDEDFAKQLQAGMSELLGELDTNPDMQAQFEAMMKELSGATGLGEAAGLGTISTAKPAVKKESKPKAGSSSSAQGVEESFQDTIKKTMERMRESGDNATAAATSDAGDDILAEMMKAMQASGMDGGEGGSEEDFSKMLLGMMEQLTNKEILYEPMKELDDKFPAWMESNKGKVEEGDMKRYKEQQVFVREIVGRFEKKGYSDDNAADREYIVERMQKMQAAGSPPPDLVGGMEAAQEAFGAPEEGCPQQ